MPELAEFFKTPYTSMGVFYPTDYALITFRSYHIAQEAAAELLARGAKPGEVRFIPPNELLAFFDDLDSTVSGMLGTALSRVTDTEAANALLDAQRAKEGAAFVAVHCPSEDAAVNALGIVRRFEPMAMDYYVKGGVQSLISASDPAAVFQEDPDFAPIRPFQRNN